MFRKILFLCSFIFIFLVSSAFATIWRVDSNTGSTNADFTNLQAAHDGAADGDTLYLIGSPHAYGSLALSKKLFIYGSGYWLVDNPNTQANKNWTTCGEVWFNGGSEGSLMTGMNIDWVVHINVSNIHLKRNLISFWKHDYDQENYIVELADNLSNINIEQNYIWNESDSYGSYIPRGLKVGENCVNIIIKNNYIGTNCSYDGIEALYSPYSTSVGLIIAQNIFHRTVSIRNAVFQNNILKSGQFWNSNCTVLNNIADGSQLDAFDESNQKYVGMDSVFVNTGSPDGKWQLAEGSPAIGTGTPEGTDIGMFGGLTPYVLSGMPELPAVYFFKAPAVIDEETGLPVHVKIKSHD
jgi:hypothetical protein